ncbi:MAG: AraC family transcriptional regulator [Chloroflexota bacterium]
MLPAHDEIPLNHFSSPNPDDPLAFEIARIEEKPPKARSAKPNRHTFYELFYLTEGSGLHYIDFKGYPIQPHTFYAVTPGQVHYWGIEQPIKGYVILFLNEFVSLDQLHSDPLRDFDFYHRIDRDPIISLPAEQAPVFQGVINTLMDEYQNKTSFGRAAALQSQFRYLLICLQRYYVVTHKLDSYSSDMILIEQFQQLIDKHFISIRTVQAYADMLGITARYLTMIAKQVTGQSAGTLIRNRLIIEAKRLLAHTNLTAGEICYTLHFADQSYFGRLFKREVGQSPLAFRTSFRKSTKT